MGFLKFEFFDLMTKIYVTRAASFTPQWTQIGYKRAARRLVTWNFAVKDYGGPMVRKALS
jgi:hypothetical protein